MNRCHSRLHDVKIVLGTKVRDIGREISVSQQVGDLASPVQRAFSIS